MATWRRRFFAHAQRRRQQWYGRDVYKRGLIEFTNYCRNDCYYCGIRASNRCVERYRLTHDEILTCCRVGYELGFRTFVLQGGEDLSFKDDELCALIRDIKAMHGDCAITLSIGERSHASYEHFLRRVRIGICCGMRRRMRSIMRVCIRRR